MLLEPQHIVCEAGVFREMHIADSLKGEVVVGADVVWDRPIL